MDNNNKEKNFASAVVYMHNDAGRVADFIGDLDRTLADNFLKYEIIVVNDFSTDEGAAELKRQIAGTDRGVVTLLNMSYHHGVESAMNAGVDLSIGDFVFEFDTMDSDFPWETLMEIYRHSLTGYDIVNACSNVGRPGVGSRGFYWLMNKYADLQYDIEPETFRVLSRRAVNRIHDLSKSIPYRKASYANCGLKMATKSYESTGKAAKKKRKGKLDLALTSLILFTDVAFRAAVTIALCMVAITIGVAIYALVYRIFGEPVEGWTTTILFLSFSFCCLFVIMAMVLKYLSTLVRLNFLKKTYVFESIEKLQ